MKAKILLVDDRPENLYSLEAILEPMGQELVFARSGEAAVEAASTHEFAVILLDVVMPGMDGFETATQIKRHGSPDVPILFLSAAGPEPELVFRGYAAGAVDYISKPFDPWVLRAKVTVFVDLYLKDRAMSGVAALLPEIEDAAAGLAGMPAALTAGMLTPDALKDGLARLDEAITALRSRLSSAALTGISDISGC